MVAAITNCSFGPTNCSPFHTDRAAETAKRTNQLLCVKSGLLKKIPVFRDAVTEALKECSALLVRVEQTAGLLCKLA